MRQRYPTAPPGAASAIDGMRALIAAVRDGFTDTTQNLVDQRRAQTKAASGHQIEIRATFTLD